MMVLARADAGQQSLRLQEVYLNELVEDCCRGGQTLAASAGVSLTWESGDDIPFLGDPELLQRMTVNLVNNAILYTPSGGWVSLRLLTGEGSVRLIVAD